MTVAEQPTDSHCIRHTAIPHSTRLFTDFLYHFESVRPFYRHDPFDDQSFFRVAEALRYPAATRDAVCAALEEQAARFGSGEATRRNIERLRRGAAAAVTGQQVGLYTGPAFAFYKALTAIRLADSLTSRGLDCVPVFWLATEDHDLHEVDHAFLLDASYSLQRVEDQGSPHVPNAPVGNVEFGTGIGNLTERVIGMLPQTEWTPALAAALRESYRPGETFGSACGRLLARIFERFGLILLDPQDARLRRLAAPVFQQAAARAADLGAALLRRNGELTRAGYHAQVHVTENTTLLFQLRGGERTAVRQRNGEFLLGDDRLDGAELLAHVAERPENFSANVLLRPVVQDTLLPTVAYISGPAELAYLAQSAVVYDALAGRMPVVYPRGSYTLLDQRTATLLAGYGLEVPDILGGAEALREKMAQRLMPSSLADAFSADERLLRGMLDDLRARLEGFDHTLADAVATSSRKMLYQLSKIRRKAARAAGRKSQALRDDAAILENVVYPHKNLQERVCSGIWFLARFGPALLDRIYEQAAAPCPDHQVLVLDP